MTLYNNRTFTVAPSGSYDQAHAMCRQHGHMEPDQRGKCLRCGEKANPEDIRGERIAEYDAIETVPRFTKYTHENKVFALDTDAEATELGRS